MHGAVVSHHKDGGRTSEHKDTGCAQPQLLPCHTGMKVKLPQTTCSICQLCPICLYTPLGSGMYHTCLHLDLDLDLMTDSILPALSAAVCFPMPCAAVLSHPAALPLSPPLVPPSQHTHAVGSGCWDGDYRYRDGESTFTSDGCRLKCDWGEWVKSCRRDPQDWSSWQRISR